MISAREDGTILLASYPKSGNTWLRFIVYHLHHGRMPEHSIELDQFINSKLNHRGARYRKTHATRDHISSLGIDVGGIITIVRHPLDVLQSALNYALLTGEVPPDANRNGCQREWIEKYVEHRGHPAWIGEPINAGSWPDNVLGWMRERSAPILSIRYEDTLADPICCIRRIASFLQIEVDSEAIQHCSDQTRFDALRAFEEAELQRAWEAGSTVGRFSSGARLKTAKSGLRFFQKGTSGSYRTAIAEDLLATAWRAFASAAEELNYKL